MGPNGAGKTTAMKILACLMNASAGEAYIDGISIVQNPAKAKTYRLHAGLLEYTTT